MGKLAGTLDEYAQTYVAGNKVASSHDEARPGATGRSYLFGSGDGATRYSLLLLKVEDRVIGLYAQGETRLFEHNYPLLEEMAKSLTPERAASYPEERDDKFGFRVRIPPSWRETRDFSGGGTLLRQFQSPPLAVDRDRQTIAAHLNLSVDPLEAGATLEDYYSSIRQKLGQSFLVVNHTRWKSGYVDVARMETPLAVSRVKRFYLVEGGRGYSLSFEVREDVYPRVSRWYDLIASTFQTESERASK